jgi:hypothetical protein
MTATMILKEIRALPAREKTKLLKKLDREREQVEASDDVRLFDEAKREVAGEKPDRFSEKQLLEFIENIGRKQRTALTAKEMNEARFEGRK